MSNRANEEVKADTNTKAPEELSEIEKLQAELEEAKAIMKQQAKLIKQQSEVIQQNVETFDKIKDSTAADTITGQNVMLINEMMKEKVKVFYPYNPFDPNKTHVVVQNPVTGRMDKVAVGQWVEVNRAVAEILERSAKGDKITLMLQEKKAKEAEDAEKSADEN